VVRFAEAEEVLKKSKLRIQNENEKKERFKKGELGLDIYEMRERLKNKGLKYE
jgi:4-hydroxy-4-methyl-2-oxoglutarate aldolase